MEIKININKKKQASVSLSGKFNIESVLVFEEKIEWLFEQNIELMAFNLQKMSLIDSSGIGSLIKALNTAKNQKIEFILYNVTEQIVSIFKVSFLDKFFIIKDEKDIKKLYPDLKL